MKGCTLIHTGALLAALLWVGESGAGEGTITKVRGLSLSVDQGTKDGLIVGMEVRVVRPPGEPIIHPVTGENMGAPEIEIGFGEITRVSDRAAAVRLRGAPLMAVQPGDVVRFTTPDEELVLEQEQATVEQEQATRERRQIRENIARLTRNIQGIQSTIRMLDKAVTRLERVQKNSVQPQINAINKDINTLKEKFARLEETVMLQNATLDTEIGEGGKVTQELVLSDENKEQLRQIIQEEIQDLRTRLEALEAAPAAVEASPPEPGEAELEELEVGEETPFYTQVWFIGGLGLLGLVAVGLYLYLRAAGGEEDEGDEEDEELDEEDEDLDLDEEEIEVEEEEADDIVVEPS